MPKLSDTSSSESEDDHGDTNQIKVRVERHESPDERSKRLAARDKKKAEQKAKDDLDQALAAANKVAPAPKKAAAKKTTRKPRKKK